uniref:FAD dependent oxidoreductase domain-containing protein n=1 Tax=Moniliophthora roreri TaxID=221103 RepID=A0A0W0G7J2_MONRR
MCEVQHSSVNGFLHDHSIVHKVGILDVKWKDAYQILSSVIDTDAALIKITRLVRDKGVKLINNRVIKGDLLSQKKQLLEEYSAQVIINATGLGAKELAHDKDVYPLCGAVLRLLNDGTHFPKIKDALIVSATLEGHVKETDFTFIPTIECQRITIPTKYIMEDFYYT